jgi:uncharacterized membrane protein
MRHLHKQHKYDAIVVMAMVAFGVSLYLAITNFLGYTVPCNVTGGCETVLNSKYASVFGVPLSLWGTVYFSCVIVMALLANHYRPARKLLTFILSAGGAGALVFLSLQFFVLKQVCQYCFIIDMIGIGMLLWDLNVEHLLPQDILSR